MAMAMASSLSPYAFFLIITLMASLTSHSHSHSMTCMSKNLTPTQQKLYTTCTDLPFLAAKLHYAHDAKNSSLSIAFMATPPTPDGWVAWAINPTGDGMLGAQSLIAFRSGGSVVVKTYNISSYGPLPKDSKLSFEVWDLAAESSSDGEITIFATVKVPKEKKQLNQVWQVGSTVTKGTPQKHAFEPANLRSKSVLNLVAEGMAPVSPSTPMLAPTIAPSPSMSPAAGAGSSGNQTGEVSRNSVNVGIVLGFSLFIASLF